MSDKELQSLMILMKELSTKFDGHVGYVKEKFEIIEKEKFTNLEKMVDGKAGKWTEKVLTTGAATICLYILGALLGLFSIPMVSAAVGKSVLVLNNYISLTS